MTGTLDKWCIKITQENIGIINSNRIPNYFGYISVGKYLHSEIVGSFNSPISECKHAGFTEITIDKYLEKI